MLEKVILSSPVAITVVDRGGQIVYANAHAEKILGLKEEKITRRTYNAPAWKITDNKGQPVADEDLPFSVVGRTREPIFGWQHAIEWPDGRRVFLSINAVPLLDERGEFDGMVATLENISARIEAENRAREIEQRYQQLVEASPEPIAIHVGGKLVYANAAGLRLIGADSLEQVTGKALLDFVHPDYHQAVLERVQWSIKNNAPLPPLEEKFVRLDGTTIDVEVAAIPLTFQNAPATQVILRDLTDRKRAEDALRSQEFSYRGLFNSVSEAIYIQDREGRFLDVNDGAVKMYGHPREFFIGKTPVDIGAPGKNDLEKVKEMVARAFAGEPQQFEFWGVRSNGGIFPKDVRVYKGSYFGQDVTFALARDISERKLAEERLLQSERRFRAVIESSPMGFHIYQAMADGRLVLIDANPAANRILGIDHAGLIGKTIEDAFPALAATEIPARYRQVALRGGIWHSEQFVYEDQQTQGIFDVYVFQTDQAVVAAMFAEITDRRKADEALRESQQMLRLVLDTIPVRVFWKDRDLKFLGANQPFADDAGVESPEDLIGKDDFEMVWADQAEQYRADASAVIDTGVPKLNYEEPQTTPSGSLIWVRASLVPLFDGRGQISGVLGTYVDITSDKRTEQNIQRRLKELTILNAVATASARAVSVDALIEQVTEVIAETLGFEDFGVMLLDPAGESLVPHPSYHGRVMEHAPWVIKLPGGVSGRVVQTGQPCLVADVTRDPDYVLVDPGKRSELCVPIKVKDRVIGVINTESTSPDFFGEEDEKLLITIAGQLAIGIEKLHLLDSERARRQEADTLRQVAQVISSSLELDEVLDGLLSSLKQVVPYDSASVFFEEKDGLRLKAVRGFADPEYAVRSVFPVNTPLFKEIRKTGKPLLLQDAHADKRFKRWGNTGHVRGWMGVPLVLRGVIAGYITLDSSQAGIYTDEMAHLALAFAYQAGVAIEHARLYEQALSASERRAILHQASEEIARASQNPDQVYETVHRATARLMPAEAFAITLLDENLREAEAVYLFDRGGRWPSQSFPSDQGLSGQVVSSGRSILIDDLSKQSNPAGIHFGETEEVRAILSVPLRLGDKVIGMLSTQSYASDAYDAEDQTLLEMLAAHAAVAIENSRLYAQTLQRLKELEAINRISTALRVAEKLEDMLPGLLDETLELLGSGSGSIELYDPATSALKTAVSRGWFAQVPGIRLRPGEGIAGTVFQSGEAILAKEFASDPHVRDETRPQVPSGWGGICVPIRSSQASMGVMFISVRLPRQITRDEANLLGTISEMAGNAIRRAGLHEQTERQLQRLASLRAIDMAISSILDVRVTLGILLDHITAQLDVDAVDILLLNHRSQALEYAAGAGFHTDAIQHTLLHMNEGLPGHVLQQRKIVHIPDLPASPHFNKRSQMLAGEDFVTYIGTPLIAKGQVKGVIEIFCRAPLNPDPDWCSFLETLAGQAAIAIDNAALFEELQRTNLDLSLAYDATIEGWSKALDLRDKETEGHTRRVVDMTLQLARAMGVPDDEMIHIRRGALLHDIGKMGIPDNILHKTGALSETEWEIMRQHPTFAYDMLYPISYLRLAINIPYCHHERWDGSGYPRRLKGEQIPLAARIFAVVDVWDAITSDRPYRKAWPPEAALTYIREQAGTHFDPQVVDTFLRIFKPEA